MQLWVTRPDEIEQPTTLDGTKGHCRFDVMVGEVDRGVAREQGVFLLATS
jgi:hypothetical protein